jgi:signal transduction histidine kinase
VIRPVLWRNGGPLFAALLAAAAIQDVARDHASPAGALAGWALVVAAWAMNRLRPHAVWAAAIGLGSLELAWVGAVTAGEVALAVSVIALARRLSPVPGAAAALVVLVANDAVECVRTGEVAAAPLVLGLIGGSALFAFTVTLGRLQREQARTMAALEDLRVSREAQVEAARGEERIRLAREMHDVLGHTLSALAVQLEGARLLLEREGAAPPAIEAVARSRRLAREGLDEARRAVGALRGDDLPGPDLLPGLVARFRRDTGVEAHLVVEGRPSPLAPEARLALYRAAQEALTNVRRHASPSCVDVRLRWGPDGAELIVENDGVAEGPGHEAGYGLTGMRERAALLGGELEVGSAGGRFRVRLRVPAAG